MVSMMLQTVPVPGMQRVYCVAGTMLPTADHRLGLGAGWMTSGHGLTHTLSRCPWVSEAQMNQVGRGRPSEAQMNQVGRGGVKPVGPRIGPVPLNHQPMKPRAHLPSAVR